MKKLLFLNILAIGSLLTACSSDDNNQTVNQPTACETAAAATITAEANYEAATGANFAQACIAYKAALQNQITVCGDTNGNIQLIIDGLGDCSDNNQCLTAAAATATARANYEAATEANFAQRCVAYKTALQNQKAACGDANGDIQDIIDSLGDCSAPSAASDGTITVVAGSNPITFDQVTVVKVGTTLKVTGETSAANNYSIYFEIQDGVVGANPMQNFQIQLTSAFHIYDGEGQFQFANTITTNSAGIVNGTFHGYVQNADNGMTELTQGNIHLDF